MKICLAGEGAMGVNHMKALSAIAGIEVMTLAGGIDTDAAKFAREWDIPHWSLDLASCLSGRASRHPGDTQSLACKTNRAGDPHE